MEFMAQNIYYQIENEILTIAFADSMSPDPENYLILQREIDNLEYYYYEINDRKYSNNGGIKQVEILDSSLFIEFQENQKIFKDGIKFLKIKYKQPDKNLNENLIYLFEESDCKINISSK